MEHSDSLSPKGSRESGLRHSCSIHAVLWHWQAMEPTAVEDGGTEGLPGRRRHRHHREVHGQRLWALSQLKSSLPRRVFLARTRSRHLSSGGRRKDREETEPGRLLLGDSASPRLLLHASDVMDGAVGAWRPDESYFPCSAVVCVISSSQGKMHQSPGGRSALWAAFRFPLPTVPSSCPSLCVPHVPQGTHLLAAVFLISLWCSRAQGC